MFKRIFGDWTHKPVKLDYSQVTVGLNKISKILAEANSREQVESAARMFKNFTHMYSTAQEREQSHILYGINEAIAARRAEFEISSEVPYNIEPLKFTTR